MRLNWILLSLLTLAWGCETVRGEGGPVGGSGGDGSMGNGGDRGTGDGDGDGDGDDSKVECVDASDCPAADACNAAATCEDGVCVAGSTKCEDFDTANCACVEVEGDCKVQGADSDGDGAKSMLCEVDPGDDCDDERGSVYPGAEELCDGLDNDCNGLLDLDDGLEPFVRRVDLPKGPEGGLGTALAWSPLAEAYVTAWTAEVSQSGGPVLNVHLGLIGLDGSFKETIPSVIARSSSSLITPVLASGEKELALAIQDGASGNFVIKVQRIARTGNSTIGALISIPLTFTFVSDLQLTSLGPDDWLLSYRGTASSVTKTYVTRIHEGAVVSATAGQELTDSTESFASTDGTLLPWFVQSGSNLNFKWSAFASDSLETIAKGNVGTSSAYNYALSPPGKQAAFSFKDSSAGQVDFFSVNAKEWECQNVATPYLGTATGLDNLKLPDGWVLVSSVSGAYAATDIYFSRVYSDCSASEGFAQQALKMGTQEAAWTSGMAAFGNGKGVAVVWSPRDAGADDIRRVGLFGPNICDDPDQ